MKHGTRRAMILKRVDCGRFNPPVKGVSDGTISQEERVP